MCAFGYHRGLSLQFPFFTFFLAMASPAFTQADFAKWKQTTSVFHLPKRLVGLSKLCQLRTELVRAIGEAKVSGVQALSGHAFRVQFKSASCRHQCDINGITFRGVTITPHPAYEEVKSVFVDRAPFQMPDQMIIDALTPYGRVLLVKTLTIQGFAAVKSGTRLVSMVIATAIPAEIRVAGFQLAFKYRGQDPTCFACRTVGHTVGNCPKSRKKRSDRGASAPQRKGDGHNTPPPPHGKVAPVTSKSPAVSPGAVPLAKSNPPDGAASQRDLREVLNASKGASKKAPPKDPPPFVPQHTFAVDLPSAPAGRSAARSNRAGKGCRLPGASTAEQSLPTESPLQRDSFDFTMEVAATPAPPAASKWAAQSNRTVSQQEGKALEVEIPNLPAGKAVSSLVTRQRRHWWQRSPASTRIVGSKTGHSSSSESDSSMRRPVHKRPKAVEGENTTPGVQANGPNDGPWAPSSSPLKVQDLDECLDGA